VAVLVEPETISGVNRQENRHEEESQEVASKETAE